MKVILIADNNLTRRLGLMGHRPLEKDECAYFYFKEAGKHSFWNNNVSFPISLIFCDEDGKVMDIGYLKENQLDGVYPEASNIRHVIEAHVDAPRNYGIEKNCKISIDDRGGVSFIKDSKDE